MDEFDSFDWDEEDYDDGLYEFFAFELEAIAKEREELCNDPW